MAIIQPLNDLSVYLSHLVKGRLWLKVIIGLVLGSGLGLLINPAWGWVPPEVSERLGSWLNLPGEVFMKLVQMVMIPLIVASIISGLVSNASDKLGSIGLRLFLYFLFTTVVAIVLGTVVAFLFNPGEYVSTHGGFSGTSMPNGTPAEQETVRFNLPESISNLIPVNPLEAMLRGELLSVVIFTIIIGIATTQIEEKMAQPVIRFIAAIQKICMIVVGWAMKLVPYAVFGLMASLLSTTGIEIFMGLGYYMLVVLLGLALLILFYLLMYGLVTRQNPLRFLSNIRDAQLLAFSTASSAAVMPLSMKVADEKLKVSSQISDFVIPIGATINMDGTALFQCVTVLFMAHAYGIELALLDVVLITFTVVGASIGTPAIPGG
ncbi:MAG TPA: dicarboxylate/amino acid:cation symporter, partial [Cytophagales bacterium]|nr:dicarboxylate/amino acid:cation symporter [Cytophagales bacterium]